MRQEFVKTAVERGGNFTEKAFTIKADAKMFSLLSDKIYADKPAAIIRELTSNAYDAHSAAGCTDVSPEIHVPNELYPFWSVRDYGRGMSHEEMFDTYTTYSESTKTNTNKEIGMFGVGAKSPFAYSDVFTIVSRIDKTKRIYSAYIGEEGIPVLALMNEEASDEPSGLEVIVPIKKQDFFIFVTKTFSVLQYFAPQPNITGTTVTPLSWGNHDYKYRGTGWGFRNNSGEARVIQGGVYYPIDFKTVFDGSIPIEYTNLVRQPLDLYFDMFDSESERGNLDVALSREALSYDKYTREQLQRIVKVVMSEIGDKISDDLKDATTFWEACIRFSDIEESLGLIVSKKLEWNGRTLTNRLDYNIEKYSEHISITMFAQRKGWRNGSSVSSNINGNVKYIKFFVNDIVRGGRSRVRLHSSHNMSDIVVLFEFRNSNNTQNDEFLKALIEDLGSPPIKNVSDLPKPTYRYTTQKKVSDESIECVYWGGKRYNRAVKNSWVFVTVNVADGGYYVPINGYTKLAGLETSPVNLDQIYTQLCELDGIPTGTKIYGLNKRATQRVIADPKWVDVISLSKTLCVDKSNQEKIHQIQLIRQIKQHYYYKGSLQTLLNRSDRMKYISANVKDPDVIELFDVIRECTVVDKQASSLFTLATCVKVVFDHNELDRLKNQYVDRIDKAWDTFLAKFPIIRFLNLEELGNSEFDKAFINLINRGVV